MKVYVMRGLPGSGKSSWVLNHIAHSHTTIQIVSADSYHMVTEDGKSVYRFKRENAKAAHDACLRAFVNTLDSGYNEVVVDNTNLSVWEIAPYVRLAEAYGCEVEIVHCVCSIFTAMSRNKHEVPALTIYTMSQRVDELPSWWKQTIVPTEFTPTPSLL